MIIGIDASRANHEQKTGVEWYAYHIIEEIKKLETEKLGFGNDIQFVLYTDQPLKGELANLPPNWTQKVLRWPPKRFWTQIRLSIEMLLHPPDLLFIPAHVFPIIHPKKTVMTVHDVAAVRFPETYNWFERWYTTWSAKTALKKLWKIIVPSEFTRQEIEKLRNRETEGLNEKIVVIPHGNFHGTDIQDIRQILDKYSIRQPFLLSVGRLEEKKNTWRIIEAFTEVRKYVSNLQLVLIGKPGYGYEDVRKAIEKSPYKDDIIIPGWVEQSYLQTILQAAEIFVFPSLYEGFGLPILESFAARVPVIASRGTSLEEVGGEAVYLVQATDTPDIARGIQDILSNATLREQLISLGHERLKNYSWAKAARETFTVLVTGN